MAEPLESLDRLCELVLSDSLELARRRRALDHLVELAGEMRADLHELKAEMAGGVAVAGEQPA